jgi:hypothetical protein
MDCGKVWAGPCDCTKPCAEQDGVRLGQAAARGALRRHDRSLPFGGISVVVSAEIVVGFRWGCGGGFGRDCGGVSVGLRRGFGEDAPRRGCDSTSVR